MATREDLLSTVTEMPTFAPPVEETAKNVIQRHPDGTITMVPKEQYGQYRKISHDLGEEPPPEDWNENLADGLSPNERMRIADELIEFFDIDEQVRQDHFKRIEDALTLLGVKDLPEAGAPFPGAATVTHPLIAEACTQFQARAIEELFPPGGPVKPYIVGKGDEKRIAQGDRLAEYMNYQMTEQDGEYYWSTDQMLFYLPVSGSAFKKCFIDPITGMTTSRFVTAEDFVVPYHARTLQHASRYAHRYEMHANDVMRAQATGAFLKDARLIDAPRLVREQDYFGRGSMEDVSDDRASVQHEDDVIYTMIEYHVDYRMPWDNDEEIAPPYIVTLEYESREVLSVRRNWRHTDETKQKRIWFVQYKYLPGLGFYGFGLLHLIGALAKAISGGIRALLDSAIVANLQGGFRSKELNAAGRMRFIPGEWQPVDASIEDLSKGFFNIPAKEPSTALATLVSSLIEEGRRFASTTENMVGDADNRGPVGTTLALIEQGSKVQSGIHKRMHKSAREEFKLIATLNYEFMDEDEYPYEVQGEERTILKQDFDGRVDVIPVSDPNIWSSTQRIAQAQAVMQMMIADPTLYSRRQKIEAHRRMYQALRVPDIDTILPKEKQQRCDPITENMDFLTGKGAVAYPDQDHRAHIAIHMNFGQHQAAENAELYKHVDPVVQAHVMEHRAYLYREEVEQTLGIKLPPLDLANDESREELPIDVENMISLAVATRLKPPVNPEGDAAAREVLDEAQAKEQARDIELIGKVQRAMTEHAAKMQRDRSTFESDEERKDRAAIREEGRRDAAVMAEQRREDLAAVRERKRKDKESEQDIEIAKKKARATFSGMVRAPTSNAKRKARKARS